MVKLLFSPLIINDAILKLGKMSSAAAIVRNLGFSLKNRNSKLSNFCEHGTQFNSTVKAYWVKLNV